MLEKIRNILNQNRKELEKNFGIKEIGIFGSYIREEQNENSDLDILVSFEKNAKMDLIRFVELEEHLTQLLGVKVDLVMKTALKPNIGKNILQEVIYI